MNILAALFGIFRRRGLVNTLKEGHSLVGFALSAILFSIVGGVLYGFAMGVGLGIETAVKDAIKIGLIFTLTLLISIPIFWLAYRLLGRQERPAQVAAIPLTLAATVAIILAVTAPIVFMLSVLAGFSPEAVYIHIVIVDLALLVGIYLSGTLIYHSFSDLKRLLIPNVVGFLMMGVVLVVLMSFLGPFLTLHPTFSVGTDRLKDGLGIGVAQKVDQALAAAQAADRVVYRFQTTNDNGDLTRDYSVSRVGNDYLIEVHLHAIPGETIREQQWIWALDGNWYTDFDGGRVDRAEFASLTTILEPALPAEAFALPSDFASASWRAYGSGDRYTITGNTQTLLQTTIVLDAHTQRVSGLNLGSADTGLHAEMRISDFLPATLDRVGLEATLNQAIVVGSVDRSDASMQDYVQEETFFVVRHPRDWRAGTWNSSQRHVTLTHPCGTGDGCPTLDVRVYDLAEGKGPRQYAEDLSRSLSLQPQYREARVRTTTIGDRTVGVVEYLFDRPVLGKIETTHHIEYIYVGQISRYHLDFSVRELQFETYRDLFEEMAGLFAYLSTSN